MSSDTPNSATLSGEWLVHFGHSLGLFYVALREQRKGLETSEKALEKQTEGLGQQIKEFDLQRVELAETRQVFKEQSETLLFLP